MPQTNISKDVVKLFLVFGITLWSVQARVFAESPPGASRDAVVHATTTPSDEGESIRPPYHAHEKESGFELYEILLQELTADIQRGEFSEYDKRKYAWLISAKWDFYYQGRDSLESLVPGARKIWYKLSKEVGDTGRPPRRLPTTSVLTQADRKKWERLPGDKRNIGKLRLDPLAAIYDNHSIDEVRAAIRDEWKNYYIGAGPKFARIVLASSENRRLAEEVSPLSLNSAPYPWKTNIVWWIAAFAIVCLLTVIFLGKSWQRR